MSKEVRSPRSPKAGGTFHPVFDHTSPTTMRPTPMTARTPGQAPVVTALYPLLGRGTTYSGPRR